jgi:2-amino-4-hydroxy-6-hydroxymethyldihydropteridine diphosphokinase
MSAVYVAIGGNIDPAARLARAARELRRRFPGAHFSSVYRNPAYGFEGADFYNAVAGFDTTLEVETLLDALHEIETLCGRARDDAKWAPRAMDIDLLLYGERIARAAHYQLPRPDLLRRSYMLAPLAELAPDLRHPLTGRRMADHWQELASLPHVHERVALDLNNLAQ